MFDALKNSDRYDEWHKRFCACFKALCFFLRSLQDVFACILQELNGEVSGRSSSMRKIADRRVDNGIREALDNRVPGYLTWFAKFKEIRDGMKYGLSVSYGYEAGPSGVTVIINTRDVYESPGQRVFAIKEELSLRDLADALFMSLSVCDFLRQHEVLRQGDVVAGNPYNR